MPVTTREQHAETRRPRRRGSGGSGERAGFRGDVEGLRAVAVLLVMIYHAGVGWLPGGFVGVDVFFVVSGFVITNQLLRELESTGRLSLLGFYGRRAKRLLPAAGVVLVVTTLASWLLVSRVQWQQIGGDIIGAAVYVVNWVFSARSVDYLAEDVEPSPVLHFWSLAVEEQFYLIWPLVMLGLFVALSRRAGVGARHRAAAGADRGLLPRRRSLAIGLAAVVVVPSLVFSVAYTAWRPAEAFFITPTRLWELGVGGLVAVLTPLFGDWRQRTGALAAWAGFLAVVASGFLMHSGLAWPGVAAALPVLGTAAVIAGGAAAARVGAARLLGWAPLVWIGGLSYSLYLWHWPLLRFWEWQFGAPTVTQGLAVVTISFLPAWLSYRYVESPIRHAKTLNASPRYALSLGLNFTAASLVAGLVLVQVAGASSTMGGQATGAGWAQGTTSAADARAQGRDEPAADEEPAALPPPGLEQPGDPPFFDRVTPDPLRATEDVPTYYGADCGSSLTEVEVRMCEYGDLDSEIVVAVVGDSKAGQWMPALETIATERGWLLRIYTKSACSFGAATPVADGKPYADCVTWSRDVMDRLTTSEKPDLVITSSIRAVAEDESGKRSTEALTDGYVDYWTVLGDQGTPVVALSDTPQPMEDPTPYECAAEHPGDFAARCSWPSDDGIGSAALHEAAERVDTATYLDLNPWVCPEETCVAVYRNVLTYRQGSHITATFAEVLSEPLASSLVPLVVDAARR